MLRKFVVNAVKASQATTAPQMRYFGPKGKVKAAAPKSRATATPTPVPAAAAAKQATV